MCGSTHRVGQYKNHEIKGDNSYGSNKRQPFKHLTPLAVSLINTSVEGIRLAWRRLAKGIFLKVDFTSPESVNLERASSQSLMKQITLGATPTQSLVRFSGARLTRRYERPEPLRPESPSRLLRSSRPSEQSSVAIQHDNDNASIACCRYRMHRPEPYQGRVQQAHDTQGIQAPDHRTFPPGPPNLYCDRVQ